MLDRETIAAAAPHARRLGVEPAALLAVIEVESNGVVFAQVGKRNEPLIRWEGHYFDRRLSGEARDKARRLGFAHPRAGGVKNPGSQAARYKLLIRAAEIDSQAAFESCSWGVGQVMGAHWKVLGFNTVSELVNLARSGVSGQIELMARFIEQNGLQRALQRRDFAAFARAYNGPNYAKLGYDRKIASAYRRYAATPDKRVSDNVTGMLRVGSRGLRVRELQQLLTRAGFPVSVDGDFGQATERSLRAFQAAEGLVEDGLAGPATMRGLERYRQGPRDEPGKQALTEIPQVRAGVTTGLGGAAGLEAARGIVTDANSQLYGLPGVEWLSTGLALAAVALAIGGIIYAARGWWQSRKTYEDGEHEELI